MTREECYKILELPINSSEEEVRKAYIKLSKKYHPDLNPNGKAKFQKISEAYNSIIENKFDNVFENAYSNSNNKYNSYNSYNTYNSAPDFKNIWRNIWNQFKKIKQPYDKVLFVLGIIGKILAILGTIFIFFKPLLKNIIFILTVATINIFSVLKYVSIVIFWIMTIVIMNILNFIISAVVLMYKVSLNPILFVLNKFFGTLAPFIKDIKLIMLLVIAISVVVKLMDKDNISKVKLLTCSTIVLMIIIIFDFFV